MPHDPNDFADMVVMTVKAAMAPVIERLAVAEARLMLLGDVRDRVVAIETKDALQLKPDLSAVHDRLKAIETIAAIPTAAENMLSDVKARLAQLETKSAPDVVGPEMASLRERVAVLEVRPVMPGPVGEPGPAGKDGTAGLSFEGVYQEGQTYEKGHLVTWAGSSWHCNATTTTKPGDGSKDWTLMVKRGRDGKDGVDAPGAAPVVSVRRAG